MNVELKLVKEEEKRVLANMLQLYLHDITRFLHMEMNNEGLFEYKYLDNYWTNKDYIPYFIIADNKIAGFILVNNDFLALDKGKDGHNIAEFFIMNSFKRKGIGKKASHLIFDMYPGNWEVRPVLRSEEAKVFWENIIKEYTDDHYEVHFPKPKREIITFNNKALLK